MRKQMENDDFDCVIHIPDNDITSWVMEELKYLRFENKKLRKVAEACEIYINDKYIGTGIIEDALKEWKGE